MRQKYKSPAGSPTTGSYSVHGCISVAHLPQPDRHTPAFSVHPGRHQIAATISNNPKYITLMNQQTIIGKWNEIKGKLKQKYSELTDDDLRYVEGKEDELYGRLQQRIGKTKDDIKREIDSL